jgi:long-chain acyl-CoA synthetase
MTRFVPITEFISRNAEWYPQKTFLIFEGQRLTWQELNNRANRVCNYLQAVGIARGDRVAVLSQNCLEYPEIMFGILKACAILVPISTMLNGETVLLELQDSRPSAIFVGATFLHLVDGIQDDFGMTRRIILSGSASGWTCYEEVLQTASDSDPQLSPRPEDPYNIIYSSGTTGAPKGIVHSHEARLLFAMSCGLEFRVHNESISLVSTPFYTNGTQLIYLPTIITGGTLVLMRTFEAAAFLELVRREKCTHAFLVPTQFIRIMEQPEFSRCDVSSIEVLLSAAAPLWMTTKMNILEKFPGSKLVELYGLTEGISTVLRPDEQLSKIGSVGKPRLGGDIKIIDSHGKELPRGEIGEIAGFNFSMMTQYYRDPAKTRDLFWTDDSGRVFLKTGDIGKLDEEGYLYLLGRKKDMIISGGINIYPSDIEEALSAHPEVSEAAVIGIPHEIWGETPVALVVKRDAASWLGEEELKNWVNSRLAGYQKLAAVEFRRLLPKNDLGKVLKNELRKPYWEGFAKGEEF